MQSEELFINRNDLPEPLPKDEIEKLFIEARNGSKEAFDKIVAHNIRLVLYKVQEMFMTVNYDKKELVSVGVIGLLKATNAYDLSKGIAFTTFANKCITNEILMFLRNIQKWNAVSSLDECVFCDSDDRVKLVDKVADELDIVSDYEKKETLMTVRDLVDRLPDGRNKEILKLYYGFYGNRCYTQVEIANMFHISQKCVSNNIQKMLKRMRSILEAKEAMNLHIKFKKGF